MPSKPYDSTEHNVAESRQNRAAGRILVRARKAADMSQTEFAAAIAKRIGLPSLAQGSYSGWEIHSRTVPAAALIAAAEVARPSGFQLGDAIEAETGPVQVSQSTKLAVALEAMAEALEGDAAEQIREVAESIRPKRRAANNR